MKLCTVSYNTHLPLLSTYFRLYFLKEILACASIPPILKQQNNRQFSIIRIGLS